jgi:hypothetical protein
MVANHHAFRAVPDALRIEEKDEVAQYKVIPFLASFAFFTGKISTAETPFGVVDD